MWHKEGDVWIEMHSLSNDQIICAVRVSTEEKDTNKLPEAIMTSVFICCRLQLCKASKQTVYQSSE